MAATRTRKKVAPDYLYDGIIGGRTCRRRSGDDDEEEGEPIAESTGRSSTGGVLADDLESPNGATEDTPAPPPPDDGAYKPIPYTFRIPVGVQTKQIRHGYARCPPFHLQLDHTLAVVWCLFSEKQGGTPPLGIAQLQWALNFLRVVRTQDGEQPKDVALCIQTVQDKLLDHYAALVDEFVSTDEGEAKRRGCTPDTCEKRASERSTDSEGFQTPQARDVQSDVIVTKTLPFSVNYTEMMKSSPYDAEKFFCTAYDKSLTDSQIQEEVDYLKRAVVATSPDGRLEETRSREDMLRFLNTWRKEQLNKVQAELKRLHSIETFIENVDKDNLPTPDGKALEKKRVSIQEPEEA